MFATHVARIAAAAALCGMCMGSSCWDDITGSGSTTTTTGNTIAGPSIEVTVDGTHAGPYAASAGAFADLVDADDMFGNVSSAMITLHAVGGMDECDFTVQRYGSGIGPFASGAYTLLESTDGSTDDRTASLVGSIAVTAGGLSLTCSSDDCGALFVINVIDSAHIEGYLTANMQNPTDGAISSVVVTFYVPWQTYTP